MSSSDHTTGRRAYERVRVSLQVAYRSTGSFLISYTVDLSRGGLFLETSDLKPEGTQLDLRLQIPGAAGEVVLRGVVVWLQQEPAPGKPMGMGVQFQELEDHLGTFIDGLVRQYSGLRLLVASPHGRTRAQLSRLLRAALAATLIDYDPEEGDAPFAEQPFELAVIDLAEGSHAALALLESTLRRAPGAAVVVITANPRLRRQALDLGAHEVISSPVSQTELRSAVLRALARPVVRAVPGEEES